MRTRSLSSSCFAPSRGNAGGRSGDGSSPTGASCFISIMIACSGASLVPSSMCVRPFSWKVTPPAAFVTLRFEPSASVMTRSPGLEIHAGQRVGMPVPRRRLSLRPDDVPDGDTFVVEQLFRARPGERRRQGLSGEIHREQRDGQQSGNERSHQGRLRNGRVANPRAMRQPGQPPPDNAAYRTLERAKPTGKTRISSNLAPAFSRSLFSGARDRNPANGACVRWVRNDRNRQPWSISASAAAASRL